MTRREKIYIWKKKAHKRFNSQKFAFQRTTLQNLWEFGIAGSRVFLDDEGTVRINPLTISECLEFEDNPPEGYTVERVKL